MANQPVDILDCLDFDAYRPPDSDAAPPQNQDDHSEIEPEQIRHEHIQHEASIKAVGVFHFLNGILFLVFALACFVASFVAQSRLNDAMFGKLFAGGLFCAGLSAFNMILGSELRRLNKWARLVAIVFTAINEALAIFNFVAALVVPHTDPDEPSVYVQLISCIVWTAISTYFLYLLASKKNRMVFSPKYKDIIIQTSYVRCFPLIPTILNVLTAIGIVIIVAVLGILASTSAQNP